MHESTKIAEAFPCQLWPDLGSIRPTVSLDTSSSFELPAGERAVLSALVRLKSPRVIFEFGTFTGTTTALMADAAEPDTEIHTIDLPDSAFPPEGFNGWFTGDMVGRALVDSERPSSDKVVVHREDLSRFEFQTRSKAESTWYLLMRITPMRLFSVTASSPFGSSDPAGRSSGMTITPRTGESSGH